MADCFDVVAVRVVNERTVVVRVIHRARSGRAVVLSARGHCGRMERVHQSTALSGERDVDALGWLTGRDEEPRLVAIAESDVARQVEHYPHTERSEGLLIE